MKHESCQNFFKSVNKKNIKHCGLPPHPPLQIKKKVRKGSKVTKLKNPPVKASETMKTPDENILEKTKALKLLS